MKTSNPAYTALKEYRVGDFVRRPWGAYVVTSVGLTDAGQEYCEKLITIKPGKILSLQSHNYRRELWQVKRGILTVVLNGQRLALKEEEQLEVPVKGIHSLANTGALRCTLFERQEGICREEDIVRYRDAYNRPVAICDNDIETSLQRYDEILEEIRRTS